MATKVKLILSNSSCSFVKYLIWIITSYFPHSFASVCILLIIISAIFDSTYVFWTFYFRGNQAYASGDLSKAEDCYTQGVNCVSRNETSRSCLRALMLCFSNRAATRMSLGRMRDALRDCDMAAAIDPNFLRVQLRAAK